MQLISKVWAIFCLHTVYRKCYHKTTLSAQCRHNTPHQAVLTLHMFELKIGPGYFRSGKRSHRF